MAGSGREENDVSTLEGARTVGGQQGCNQAGHLTTTNGTSTQGGKPREIVTTVETGKGDHREAITTMGRGDIPMCREGWDRHVQQEKRTVNTNIATMLEQEAAVHVNTLATTENALGWECGEMGGTVLSLGAGGARRLAATPA